MSPIRTKLDLIEAIKTVTFRAKIKISIVPPVIIIWVREGKMEVLKDLLAEWGMVDVKYDVRRLGFFENWFKWIHVSEFPIEYREVV